MSAKFIRRTLRNVIFRERPYFAHLALTHRCNLRCRFCHVQEEKFVELDTGGMKRVIDVLDEVGVGVLSVSGGGEPLLRKDVAAILNHAAFKGLYTKITSNGTMPLDRYQQLLGSGVKEIAISLDGVDGNDLPFSHVGPRILETIRYLHDHLPRGKQLTLNVTVSPANRDQIERIVSYCADHFPQAKVWLNPVVVGDGKLRAAGLTMADPGYLRTCESESLLKADFYTAGVEEQYRRGKFDWGCLAGQMFFDIKPNGDFWLCQDKPAGVPLNVLQPDFRRRLRQVDFSHRRHCSGCTYSCYYLTQNGLDPQNWPQMAGMWWVANTRPGDRCRRVARQYGWFAGLMSFCADRLVALPATGALALLIGLLLVAGQMTGQCAQPPFDASKMLEQMEKLHEEQGKQLSSYSGSRQYVAANLRLHLRAEATAAVDFEAREGKHFRVLTRSGSEHIQRLVIDRAIGAEQAAGSGSERENTAINRRNYVFTYLGPDQESHAQVFALEPRVRNPYSLRGKVWLDETTCAIKRVEGEPARSPSFWVKRTHFVHEYRDFDGCWLPVRHESRADLLLFGQSSFVINYYDYAWQKASGNRCQHSARNTVPH